MSRGIKIKVVHLASIKHQGKFLSMLGEIGTAWRPKTRPKNKLKLNMKKPLNHKLAKKKIIVIEDSSSQEELEDIEDKKEKDMKGKKKWFQKTNQLLLRPKFQIYLRKFKRR